MLVEGEGGVENIHQDGYRAIVKSKEGLEGMASGNENQGIEENLF